MLNLVRPPFARLYPNPKWQDTSGILDLHGQVAVVLGANVGLGYTTALEVARKGAKVFVTPKSAEKAGDAVRRLKSDLESGGLRDANISSITLPLMT